MCVQRFRGVLVARGVFAAYLRSIMSFFNVLFEFVTCLTKSSRMFYRSGGSAKALRSCLRLDAARGGRAKGVHVAIGVGTAVALLEGRSAPRRLNQRCTPLQYIQNTRVLFYVICNLVGDVRERRSLCTRYGGITP